MNYKSLTLLAVCFVVCISSLLAQQASVKYSTMQLASVPRYTPVQLALIHSQDSAVKANKLISGPVELARANHEDPNWQAINAVIMAQYDVVIADRNVTRAKIFYYYGSNWPLFCNALVHYTEAFEDHGDAALMSKNAKMVLDYSKDQKELKIAASWVEKTDKNTYDAIKVKFQ